MALYKCCIIIIIIKATDVYYNEIRLKLAHVPKARRVKQHHSEWNLPWTVTRISIGHPLISVDLPVYDLPCGASIAPVLRNCVIAGLASFAPTAKWPNKLRSSSTAACLNFGVLH